MRCLKHYRPPDPLDPYYYERIEPAIEKANGRYVVVTCHFNLIERFHMLRGFNSAMEDLYLEPEATESILNMILEFKIQQLTELHRRFGSVIDGIFLTDDWGTQQSLFISMKLFDHFFSERYKQLFDTIHGFGWHVIFHSCGKINELTPRLIELGVDVLNMQQPNTYGLIEFGERFKGQVCFLNTVDVQTTLVRGIEEEVREEVRLLLRHWSTRNGGFIVFNYGDPDLIGVPKGITEAMFDEFIKHMNLG